jgi:hypothetical protein
MMITTITAAAMLLALLCIVWVYEAYILKAHRHRWQSD